MLTPITFCIKIITEQSGRVWELHSPTVLLLELLVYWACGMKWGWPWNEADHGMKLTVEWDWPWNEADHGMRLTVEWGWPWNEAGHGTRLTMEWGWPWNEAGHGTRLTMEWGWPWNEAGHGMRLTVEWGWPWNEADHGMRLTMEWGWPWNEAGHGTRLTVEWGWPWNEAVRGTRLTVEWGWPWNEADNKILLLEWNEDWPKILWPRFDHQNEFLNIKGMTMKIVDKFAHFGMPYTRVLVLCCSCNFGRPFLFPLRLYLCTGEHTL